MYRFRAAETNNLVIASAIIGLLIGYSILVGGLLSGMGSVGLISGDPKYLRIKWMSRVVFLLYFWVMLWMLWLLCARFDHEGFVRITGIYKR